MNLSNNSQSTFVRRGSVVPITVGHTLTHAVLQLFSMYQFIEEVVGTTIPRYLPTYNQSFLQFDASVFDR